MKNNVSKNNLPKITIIGAGLCGLMMALYLAKRGYAVEIFEKANNTEVNSVSDRKSIALDISERALLALSEVDLLDEILTHSVPTTHRVLYWGAKSLAIEHGYQHDHVIYNVARSKLYDILFSKVAKHANIIVNFSHELVSVDIEKRLLFFKLTNYNTMIAKNFVQVLGCDGIHSVIRHALNKKHYDNKSYSYSYKNTILPTAFSKENLKTNHMYKWIDNHISLLAHPNNHNEFNITLLIPTALENQFSKLYMNANFSHLQNVKANLYDTFNKQAFNRIQSTKVLHQAKDNILLLGDAAHGMLPFLGQGINCSFEDCRLLNQYLIQYGDNWEKATKKFSSQRKFDTNAIINLSEVEYPEFQEGYKSKAHQALEQIKLQLTKRYPHFFKTHRYLLAFTHISYKRISQLHQLQQEVVERIIQSFQSAAHVNWQTVDKWINVLFK